MEYSSSSDDEGWSEYAPVMDMTPIVTYPNYRELLVQPDTSIIEDYELAYKRRKFVKEVDTKLVMGKRKDLLREREVVRAQMLDNDNSHLKEKFSKILGSISSLFSRTLTMPVSYDQILQFYNSLHVLYGKGNEYPKLEARVDDITFSYTCNEFGQLLSIPSEGVTIPPECSYKWIESDLSGGSILTPLQQYQLVRQDKDAWKLPSCVYIRNLKTFVQYIHGYMRSNLYPMPSFRNWLSEEEVFLLSHVLAEKAINWSKCIMIKMDRTIYDERAPLGYENVIGCMISYDYNKI